MKTLLVALALAICSASFASPASSYPGKARPATVDSINYQPYLGNYKFGSDSQVPTVSIVMANGVFSYQTPNDGGPLTFLSADTYTFTATNYSGKIVFKKDGNGRVTGLTAYVNEMTFEAVKE